MDDIKNVCSVHFWKDGDQEMAISLSLNNPPSYQIGQSIYLETTVNPKGEKKYKFAKTSRLKGYKIVDVHHSVRLNYSDDIRHYLSCDVYLEEITPE